MKEKSSHYLRLFGSVLALTVVTSLVILFIAWLAKWTAVTQFSNGFFMAGTIFAFFGLFSVVGGFATRGDFKTVYSQSAGDASLADRTRRMMEDIRQGYGMLILFVSTAALLILVSVLIGHFG